MMIVYKSGGGIVPSVDIDDEEDVEGEDENQPLNIELVLLLLWICNMGMAVMGVVGELRSYMLRRPSSGKNRTWHCCMVADIVKECLVLLFVLPLLLSSNILVLVHDNVSERAVQIPCML